MKLSTCWHCVCGSFLYTLYSSCLCSLTVYICTTERLYSLAGVLDMQFGQVLPFTRRLFFTVLTTLVVEVEQIGPVCVCVCVCVCVSGQ